MKSKKVIVRKLDKLGRIVIPKDIRDKFEIIEEDTLEIFVDRSSIILRKYKPTCSFCQNTKNLSKYKEKLVCDECRMKISNLISKN